jgi:hypothetical protein
MTLRGGAGNDTIDGAGGTDSLFGDAEIDVFRGRLGYDTYNGGVGFDTASFALATAAVNANLTTGGAAGKGVVALTMVGHMTSSRFNDVLTGNSGANTRATTGEAILEVARRRRTR